MLVDIDRHILAEIVEIRRERKGLEAKHAKIKTRLKAELGRLEAEIHELDGKENALLNHIVSEIKEADTGKGQETNLGKKFADDNKRR